eukprot:SAG31_NODE_3154_length_4614_cov_2.763012_4_plen_67_part_00
MDEGPSLYQYLGVRRPRRRAPRADAHATGMPAMTCAAGRAGARTGIFYNCDPSRDHGWWCEYRYNI